MQSMSYFSLLLPGGGKVVEQVVESEFTLTQFVHITNLALGMNPQPGAHPVTLECNGVCTVLATLEKPYAYQHNMDFVVDQTVKFVNHGPTDVHVCGYVTVSETMRDDGSDEDEDEDDDEYEEDEDEDEEDEDEEEAPRAVPLKKVCGACRGAGGGGGGVRGKALRCTGPCCMPCRGGIAC